MKNFLIFALISFLFFYCSILMAQKIATPDFTKRNNQTKEFRKSIQTIEKNGERIVDFQKAIRQRRINISEIAQKGNLGLEYGEMMDIQVEFDALFCSNSSVCESEKICIDLNLGYVGYMDWYDWYVIKNGTLYFAGTTYGYESHITLLIAKTDFGGTGDYQFYCESFFYTDIPQPHYVFWQYDHTTPEYFEFLPQPCNIATSGCSDPCGGLGAFDTRNCYLGKAPVGTTPFIYDGNFYYTPINGNQCPMPGSSFDNAHCYVSTIPSNRTGFIWDGNFYLRPICDAPGPNKRIFLRKLMIKEDKESGIANGKNDISFAIAIFPKNSCNNFVGNGEADFMNVGDDDINSQTWFQTDKELTTNTLLISPNSLVAILIYEHDIWDTQSWNFNCSNDKIEYKSNNTPFGTIILPYSNFLDNNDFWIPLPGCQLILGSADY